MTLYKVVDENNRDWIYIRQGPKRNPFIDPGTGRGYADGTGKPKNILYQTFGERWPGGVNTDAFSDTMIRRIWGFPSTGKSAMDADGLKAQIDAEYLLVKPNDPATGKPTTDQTKWSWNFAQGIGIGGGGRVTVWWANGSDGPQGVVVDGFPNDDIAYTMYVAEPCPVPAEAFPAIKPVVTLHASDGSDQSMVVYDPGTQKMWEFEKTQKALHFPQVPQGYPDGSGTAKSRLDIIDPTGGAPGLGAGLYAWKITFSNAHGETGSKEKNQIDDARGKPAKGLLIPQGKAARFWFYAPYSYGTQPTQVNIYRAFNPTDATDQSQFKLMDTYAYDPATIQTGHLMSYTDDGTKLATGKHPELEGTNGAWTDEWRASPGYVLHEVNNCIGPYKHRTDGDGRLIEDWNSGGAATKIPLATGIINEQEVLDFRQRLADCRAASIPCDYVFPHALSMAGPKGLNSQTKFCYPAQSADGLNTLGNDCILQGAVFFLPPGLDPLTTMRARLSGVSDLNTANSHWDPANPTASGPDAPAAGFGAVQRYGTSYSGVLMDVDEFALAIFRTLQEYGGFVHDSNPANFILYAESPDLAGGRQTPLDPVNPNWIDALVDNDAPNIPAYNGSNSATISAKKQIRRYQQLGKIPWELMFMPFQPTCTVGKECTISGQTSTDRDWALDGAVMGASFGGTGTNGRVLDAYTGVNTGFAKVNQATIQGQIYVSGGRTFCQSIPAMYAMTGTVPTPDYSVRSSLGVFNSVTDVVVGGAFLWEHCHRIPRNLDGTFTRRHYIGLGYNSAANAFVIRAFTQPTDNAVPFPQVLATNTVNLLTEVDPELCETFVLGNWAALYYKGDLMVETDIPSGWEVGQPGINVGLAQTADLTNVQFDGIWVYDHTPPAVPGHVRRIVKRSGVVIDLLRNFA